jgi:hypothetical protein
MAAVGVIFALCACGDDDSLDEAAAKDAVNEAVNIASLTYTNVSAGLGKLDGEWVTGDAAGFTVQGSLNGTQGGTGAVSGEGKKEGTTYTFDLAIKLDGWKGRSGLVLDGTLRARYEVTNLAGGLMTISFGGDVSVGGSASGSAGFDAEVIYSEPGKYAICGDVSGVDVSTEGC